MRAKLFVFRGRLWGGFGDVAFPEQAKERETLPRSTLHIQDLILGRVSYRHGNFRRVDVESLDKSFKTLKVGVSQAQSEMAQNINRFHATPFPLHEPLPRPSGAGAGSAIGVAFW